MDKKQLRTQIKRQLKELNSETKALLDNAIYKNYLKLNISKKNVCVYNDLPVEVETGRIFKDLVKVANIYMPVVIGDDMKLVKVDENTSFEVGAFNILEPIGERLNPKDVDIDLCITPMMGADRKLNRLGKGKGYYDRFFSVVNCLKVGLCYSFAVVDEIDCEAHDIKMNYIVTDKEIIK